MDNGQNFHESAVTSSMHVGYVLDCDCHREAGLAAEFASTCVRFCLVKTQAGLLLSNACFLAPMACRLTEDLIQTAHSDKINGMAFPADYSEVFATCAAGCIRVWHAAACRELLRIAVPNLDCNCVTFAPVSALLCRTNY